MLQKECESPVRIPSGYYATLNMDGKRIINVAYPRDPVENSAYNGDVVTAKALSDFRKYLLDEVLLRNSDNVMDGRLEMSGHKIKGLGNPVASDDAVNKEYITARFTAVKDELKMNLTVYLKELIKWKKIKFYTSHETTNSSDLPRITQRRWTKLSPAENIRDRKTINQGERCKGGLIQKV